MTKLPSHIVRMSDLPNRRVTRVELAPNEAERQAIAEALGIEGLRKLRFEAELAASGGKDWVLTGDLGATAVQACVVTLDPVTTRIDENVKRRYVANYTLPDGSEVEMPEDDTVEPLPDTLDIVDVMMEALSLALPAYPRSDAAELAETVVTEPGATPLTQSEMKPFAGLAALRDKLADSSEGDAE